MRVAVRAQVYVSRHSVCPFGALASVFAWERVGKALEHLAGTLLRLPILRYVDDFLGVERRAALLVSPARVHLLCRSVRACEYACRQHVVKHGLECFERLVRIFLGNSAIASGKSEHGPCVVILGISVEIGERGFKLLPAPRKVRKWLTRIEEILDEDRLDPGEASKLAGRLSWACAQAFKQFGRANLRPLFDQVSRRDGAMNDELRSSLRWWTHVLRMGISELHEWWVPTTKPVHLFTDASGGGGGHLGAVLLIDGECHWTHMEVSGQLQGMFVNRADNQIMGLELLGVSLGMSTFEKLLWGRRVIAHCDNRGAEVSCLHPHRRRFPACVLGPRGTGGHKAWYGSKV